MLVKATDMSSKLNVRIKELHRVASPGEQFEVSPMRFEILNGKNRYKAVFVTAVKAATEKQTKKKVTKKNKVEEDA